MKLKLKAKGLTADEIATIRKTIRQLNRKRKRDNVPRIPYKLKFQNEETKKFITFKFHGLDNKIPKKESEVINICQN